jgi:hypothetical protein
MLEIQADFVIDAQGRDFRAHCLDPGPEQLTLEHDGLEQDGSGLSNS